MHPLRAEATPKEFPNWAPPTVVAWLKKSGPKMPEHMTARFSALISDHRMCDVWDWYSKIEDRSMQGSSAQATSSKRKDAFYFCHVIHESCQLPGFPGNLSAKARERYLAKVRTHVMALIELLPDTMFGSNSAHVAGCATQPIDEEDDLAQVVVRDLANWGEDETGHIVAYYVDEGGVSRLPWTYPESSLCDLLFKVLDWTHHDDRFDWGLRSVKPIEHAKGKNLHVTYFTRTLFARLTRKKIHIPFAHLATIANVVLALPSEPQIDEDAVRKQVRRYAETCRDVLDY